MHRDRFDPGKARIAFIGLGVMGEPMARNLVSAGYEVTVHNRSRAAVDRLAGSGAAPAPSPAAAASGADAVVLMLPDTPDVLSVVHGPDGAAQGLGEGSVLIDMSTIAPTATRELAETLAERGVRMLDAPVSGGQRGAEEATLSIMVGGESEVVERARPLLEALGTTITHIGGNGAGQVAKACNQVVVAGTIQSVAEALTLAQRSGVDAERVREALLGGLAGSRILEVHGRRMLDDSFPAGFTVDLHAKDLGLALDAGADAGVALLTAATVRQLLTSLSAAGDGGLDHSALALAVRRAAGETGERR